MSLRLDNRSGYSTEDLRRFLRRGLSACGVRGTVLVTVVSSPTRSRGCATVGGRRMVLAIAAPSKTTRAEFVRRLAWLVIHESEHLKGVEHGQMPKDVLYSRGPTPSWARGMEIRYEGRAPNQLEGLKKTMKKRKTSKKTCSPCAHRARDAEASPPSSRRSQTPGSYRFSVAMALVRQHRMTDARAGRLALRWERMIESRRRDGRSAASTAEHVARFESQGLSPLAASRDTGKRKRTR